MNTDNTSGAQDNRWDDAEETASERGSGESTSYLNRLTRQRLLSCEEEVALAERIRSGSPREAKRAKDRLVEANMRLVINIAKSYQNSLLPMEDLIQEGAIGLMTAAERFDPDRGFRFSTYATHWIKQAISRALDNKAKSIRVPAHVSETLRKLEKIRAHLMRELGEEPTVEQIAQYTGLSVRKLNAFLQAGLEPMSLDRLVGDEENTSLLSLLNDHTAIDPEEALMRTEKRQELTKLFSILTPREREIMERRLGYEEDSSQVLQEIGQTMHISRERVRQIEVQALKKLKFAAKRRNMASYMAE